MFNFSENLKPPFIKVICVCGRLFIPEEMYVCLKCKRAICRFCLKQTIRSFICKNCTETMLFQEAFAHNNRCSKCIACPICDNVLSIKKFKKTGKCYF